LDDLPPSDLFELRSFERFEVRVRGVADVASVDYRVE
jgi:hypothetical protein